MFQKQTYYVQHCVLVTRKEVFWGFLPFYVNFGGLCWNSFCEMSGLQMSKLCLHGG